MPRSIEATGESGPVLCLVSVACALHGVVRAAAAKDLLEATIAVRRRVWPEVAWDGAAPAWMANARASSLPGREEGRVVIFDRQAGRGAALRKGWNDGAWASRIVK